ncbi:hypothetical protein [Nocardia flavorosea]|uniref:Uncharacterized protein n=1 Tax=Nocardia flavorosea TaxID=53429 RepID=A0A846YGN7_9NOCA|nr:hypothetical protein [Nocardia flavorosea]NKY56844.1 hypothetical protein [Nocardia flavorosea]
MAMRLPWRWFRRRDEPNVYEPQRTDASGTELVVEWIDAVTTGLATAPPGPPEAAPARVCDGMFTAATIVAVLIDKIADRTEYRVANNRCMASAVDFMKVLGEDTLRRYRIDGVQPVGWENLGPEMDEALIARRLGRLGEALQLALLAVTTDYDLSDEVREAAEESGLLAADVLVEACQAIQTDPTM